MLERPDLGNRRRPPLRWVGNNHLHTCHCSLGTDRCSSRLERGQERGQEQFDSNNPRASNICIVAAGLKLGHHPCRSCSQRALFRSRYRFCTTSFVRRTYWGVEAEWSYAVERWANRRRPPLRWHRNNHLHTCHCSLGTDRRSSRCLPQT